MGNGSIDIDHLRSWVGKEETASDLVSTDLVQKFNATLNLSSATPIWGEPAPLLINYCLAQPTVLTASLGVDGHPPKGGFLPPVALPRRMWAGSSLTFHDHLRVGDLARRVSRITDVVVKEGRTGRLCFVSVFHKTDVAGVTKIEEAQQIVYRELAPAHEAVDASGAEAAPAGQHVANLELSSTLLFRYSALTFNGHRIHYDRPYATEVEHYPGLLVHGPLQATLLLHFAVGLSGKSPKHFAFRAVSPLFDYDSVRIHGTLQGSDAMRLWTARDGGPIATSAEVRW